MAVEIKELVVRAVIAKEEGEESPALAREENPELEEILQKLKQDCVKEVLCILERKNNR